MKKSRVKYAKIAFITAFFLAGFMGAEEASAAITNELQLGSTGTQVSELQRFLATNPSIYPAGIVSGYFGPLTRAAVIQFQVSYDIPQAGRVGPMTMAEINKIMASGKGLDISAPIIGSLSVQVSTNSANVNWTTNEFARGQLHYGTSPIVTNEATMHAQQTSVSGTLVPHTSVFGMSQSVSIPGLLPNTTYYYLAEAIDNSGNVNMASNSFRTNQ